MDNAVDALHLAFVAMVLIIALSVAVYMITMARQTSEIVLRTADDTAYLSYDITSSNLKGISNGSRIVSFETIIPTLFKYNFERYAVVFLEAKAFNEDGSIKTAEPVKLYDSETTLNNWNEKASFIIYSIEDGVFDKEIRKPERNSITGELVDDSVIKGVYAFDITEENYRNECWTVSPAEIRKHMETFLSAGEYDDPRGEDLDKISYENNQLNQWYTSGNAEKFIEFVGHYTVTEDADEEAPEGEEDVYVEPIHRGNKTTSKTVIIYVHIPD